MKIEISRISEISEFVDNEGIKVNHVYQIFRNTVLSRWSSR